MADHVVAIEIDGRAFTGWDTVSIGMAIDNCADQFSLSSAYDPTRRDLAETFKSAVYKPCVITIDGEPVLTGRVEKVEAKSGPDDRAITVEGRSLTAPLVDCSIDGDLQISETMLLSDLCRKVCGPFKIKVRPDNDCEVSPQRAQYGQKAYDFLDAIASPRHFFLNSSYDGKLVLTAASDMINRPVVAALIEGKAGLKSITTSHDGTLRFSVYKVATQFAGVEDAVDEAADPSVTVYRPHLEPKEDALPLGDMTAEEISFAIPGSKSSKQAKTLANKTRTASQLRTQAFAASFSASATWTGWLAPNGKRWHERQMVTLYAPGAMLSKEVRYIIAGINFKLSPESGETVDMRLTLPELYAGAMPRVLPWD